MRKIFLLLILTIGHISTLLAQNIKWGEWKTIYEASGAENAPRVQIALGTGKYLCNDKNYNVPMVYVKFNFNFKPNSGCSLRLNMDVEKCDGKIVTVSPFCNFKDDNFKLEYVGTLVKSPYNIKLDYCKEMSLMVNKTLPSTQTSNKTKSDNSKVNFESTVVPTNKSEKDYQFDKKKK